MDETNDVPMPDRTKVEAALAKREDDRTPDDRAEIDEAARWALHAIGPDGSFSELTMRNPISRVMFRAGLIACREYMARFIERSSYPDIAWAIRARWWPVLGADPGQPRLLYFDEVAERIEEDGKVSYRSQPLTASQEALPRAAQFLGARGVTPE